MEEIKVKIRVNDYKIEKSGIIENDILKVKDRETEIYFDYKTLVMTRKNKEFEISIDFKKEKIEYKIPEMEDKFINNFTLLSLTNSNKEYNIKYRVEESEFTLYINYETIK